MHKVEHTQQLPHALLPARVRQSVVLHHQVSVDLVVVVAYLQPGLLQPQSTGPHSTADPATVNY